MIQFRFLLQYLSAIFLFSVIYWISFLVDQSSFLISPSYNSRPFDLNNLDSPLDEFAIIQKDLNNKKNEFIISNRTYITLKAQRDSLIDLRVKFIHNRSQIIDENINKILISKYPDKYSEKYFHDYDSLLTIYKNYGEHGEEYPEYFELRKKIFEIENEMNKIKEQIRTENWDELLTKSDLEYLNKINQKADSIIKLENVAEDLWSSNNAEIHNLKRGYQKKMIDRIRYSDFMYYSSSVATSLTYGVLIPNNSLTRIASIIQALLSILIIGLYFNALSNRSNSKNHTSTPPVS